MKRSLIVGKANVGKTLFCVHFAQYLGIRDLTWFVERTDGRTEQRKMSVIEAFRTMTDSAMHRTRCLQSIHLEVPRGKTARHLLLTDTTGLSDGIHPDAQIREAMAQTLETMLKANIILHIVDAHEVGRACARTGHPEETWKALDQQLAAFGANHGGYVLLANKMDLPEAKHGYRWLCKEYAKQRVIPISALHGDGFREVKQHVWRLA